MSTKSRVISPSSYERDGLRRRAPAARRATRCPCRGWSGTGRDRRRSADRSTDRRHVVRTAPRGRARAPGRAWSRRTRSPDAGVVPRRRSSARARRCRRSPTAPPRAGRASRAPGLEAACRPHRRQVPSPYTARLLVSRKWPRHLAGPRSGQSRSWVVPTTLTELWRVLSLRDCAVPVSAAEVRCTHVGPHAGQHLVPGRRARTTSATIQLGRLVAGRPGARRWRAPAGARLSTATRALGAARERAAQSAVPMNPAPPVTRTRPESAGACRVMPPPRIT